MSGYLFLIEAKYYNCIIVLISEHTKWRLFTFCWSHLKVVDHCFYTMLKRKITASTKDEKLQISFFSRKSDVKTATTRSKTTFPVEYLRKLCIKYTGAFIQHGVREINLLRMCVHKCLRYMQNTNYQTNVSVCSFCFCFVLFSITGSLHVEKEGALNENK